MTSLNTIPNEIILVILHNFERTSDLKIAKAICRKWRESVNFFMKSKCKYLFHSITQINFWYLETGHLYVAILEIPTSNFEK